jgi:hypothetical protein
MEKKFNKENSVTSPWEEWAYESYVSHTHSFPKISDLKKINKVLGLNEDNPSVAVRSATMAYNWRKLQRGKC